MIAIKPATPAGLVLRAIVREDGMLTAAEIAAEVFPTPPELQPRPYRSGDHRRTLIALRTEHERESAAKVTRLISHLVGEGLVERQMPPRLDDWFLRAMGRAASIKTALEDAFWFDRIDHATIAAWAAMAKQVEQSPGRWRPPKSGAGQLTYRQLVQRGVLVAPSQRRPTDAGRERVSSWQ